MRFILSWRNQRSGVCDMIANGVWPRNQGETVRLHPSVPMNTKATVSGGLPWRDSHWPGETNDQLETTNSYLVITVGNLQMQHVIRTRGA